MNMNFYAPVNIITGRNCVKNNSSLFADFGKKCLIVTGKSGALKSGALNDVTEALSSLGIEYKIFDHIEQNPSFDSCKKASELADEFEAEFIVGIGGGSPLDAAKAIATLTVLSDKTADVLYSLKWDKNPLPIIAVGTTAGTGSEVTPVSVITNPQGMKKSFRAPTLYPAVCFGDPEYTASLSSAFIRSTALDALCHCLESYFNKTANDISKTYALRGTQILIKMLPKTATCHTSALSYDDREKLYCASLYGGLAISVTGTAFPHAMGYFLSEQYEICHGNACACYIEEFINYNSDIAPFEAENFFKTLNTDKETLISLIRQNLDEIDLKLTAEKINELAPRFENNKSLIKCFGNADREFAVALLKKKFM